MTDQEKYIEDQKASGIAVGDTVRVIRTNNLREGGSTAFSHNAKDIEDGRCDGIVHSMEDGCIWLADIEEERAWQFPYFVLEIVKKADGSVPNAKSITSETGECTMKTQEIYCYVVTIDKKEKDDNGQIDSIRKSILDDGTVAAYDKENAKLKIMADLGPLDEKADIDEVEVLVRPFCG